MPVINFGNQMVKELLLFSDIYKKQKCVLAIEMMTNAGSRMPLFASHEWGWILIGRSGHVRAEPVYEMPTPLPTCR